MRIRKLLNAGILAALCGCGVDRNAIEEAIFHAPDSRATVITTRLGESRDYEQSQIIIQTDGAYVMAGYSESGANGERAHWMLTRFRNDGSLDTSFFTSGRLLTTMGSSGEMAYALVLQTDGRLVAGGYATYSTTAFALARYLSDGTLDTSFDTDGKVAVDFSTGGDISYALVLQTDGKTVTAGYSGVLGGIVRLETDGSLDTSFATSGKTTLAFNTTSEIIYGAALTTSGEIMLIGKTKISGYDDSGAARLNTDGSLDTAFHTDGKHAFSQDSGCDTALSLQIQTDGKYVMGGQVAAIAGNNALISRLNTNGGLDTSFNTTGTKKDAPFTATKGFRVLLDTDGLILVSGQDATNGNAFLGRYTTDGQRDTNFNAVGYTTVDYGNMQDLYYGLGRLGSGKILAAGVGGATQKGSLVISQFLTDGSLDTSFFTNGKNSVSAGVSAKSVGYTSVVQTDGSVLVGGYTYNGAITFSTTGAGMPTTALALTRYTVDGQLDTSFFTSGKLWNTSTTSGELRKITLQTDGKIVGVGGATRFIARFLSDGNFDTAFATTGMANHTSYYGIAVQTDGLLVASTSLFGIGRYQTNGTLDTSFYTSGINVSVATNGNAYEVMVLNNGSLEAAGHVSNDFFVARYQTSGALDTSFNTTGTLQVNFNTGNDVAYSLSLQPDGKRILTGLVTGSNAVTQFGILRVLSSGNIDTSFHTDGWATISFSTAGDIAYSGRALRTGKILVVGRAELGYYTNDFAIARLLNDGSLDTSFYTTGKLSHSIGEQDEILYDLNILPDGRYLASGAATEGNYGVGVFALVKYFP